MLHRNQRLQSATKPSQAKFHDLGLKKFGKELPGLGYLVRFILLKERGFIIKLKLELERLTEILSTQVRKC